jgi:hydroxymethylpyrimidine/phosphomethylpyrimidine kinase
MTAITALTAQNTTGVYGAVEMAPEFIAQQIGVCVNDIGCDAVKTGMLSSAPGAGGQDGDNDS